MLKLKATTNNEKIILDYLNKNASEVLAEKINNGKKTLSQCWSYIVSEAQKLAENNCACVDDATVFGWAVHFFEEDAIEVKTPKAKPAVKTVVTNIEPAENKAPQKVKGNTKQTDQMSIFDLLG